MSSPPVALDRPELVPVIACAPLLSGVPLSESEARRLAAAMRVLADPARLRLLSLIASQPGGESCVCHLTGAFDLAQPTVSHHLKVLHQAGILGRERRGSWVYYRVEPSALDGLLAALGAVPSARASSVEDFGPGVAGGQVTRVLFLCTHNSARSQMAEGLLRHLGGDRFQVCSAGTEATFVRPLAIRAMAELGIDIRHHTSKTLHQFLGQEFEYVVTVCDQANEACPIFPHARNRLHWSFPDPSKATGSEDDQLAFYRGVRDAIRERIWRELLA